MEIRATKAVSQGSASFDVSNPDDHIIMPYVKADGKYWYLDEDDRWVDLGLSVLWAKYNVGATSPEEYGGYYAWGETETKSSYTEENYKYTIEYEEYNDGGYNWICQSLGEDISGGNYDIANIQWSNGVRIPRLAEVQELLDNCSWSVSTYNGAKGMTVTGQNGNNIFLPFAGARNNSDDIDTYDEGYYWSGTSSYSTEAYHLFFWGGADPGKDFGDPDRHIGMSVRPVKDK